MAQSYCTSHYERHPPFSVLFIPAFASDMPLPSWHSAHPSALTRQPNHSHPLRVPIWGVSVALSSRAAATAHHYPPERALREDPTERVLLTGHDRGNFGSIDRLYRLNGTSEANLRGQGRETNYWQGGGWSGRSRARWNGEN